MSIAARIAADHHTPAPWAGWCACEWIATSPDAAERPRQYAVHIAAMTEAAVRAQVAADIEVKRAEAALAATAYREAGDESAAWEAAMSAHAYGYAARIAEEGHQ